MVEELAISSSERGAESAVQQKCTMFDCTREGLVVSIHFSSWTLTLFLEFNSMAGCGFSYKKYMNFTGPGLWV